MKKEFNKKYDGREKPNKTTESKDKPRKTSFSKDFKNKEDRSFKAPRRERAEDKPFDKKFPERKKRDADFGGEKPFDRKRSVNKSGNEGRFKDRDASKFSEDKKQFGDKKFDKKPFDSKRGFDKKREDRDQPFEKRERNYSDKKEGFKEKRTERKDFDKPKRSFSEDRKPFKRREDGEQREFDKPKREFSGEKKPFVKKEWKEKREGEFEDKKREKKSFDHPKREFSNDKKPFKKSVRKEIESEEEHEELETTKKTTTAGKSIEEPMTLNKYIAHSGECSRRDAAEFVKQGKVRVNGELILEPGYRVSPGDTVTLSGKKMTPQKNLVYVLLNKPKDFITTTEDPQERKTVMDLVANSGVDRLYPVGRLDRNTTGLLLLTNDGALAHKLSHPSYNIRKVYHVTLDKNLTKTDYEKIFKGVELEDGIANVDEIAYLENRHELGLEIHNGRNRIVRRIFESLGYVVEKLDRVMYAGLTKKNLPRGKWRFLDEKEIIFLKHFK